MHVVRNQREELREEYGFAFEKKSGEGIVGLVGCSCAAYTGCVHALVALTVWMHP